MKKRKQLSTPSKYLINALLAAALLVGVPYYHLSFILSK